MTQVEVVLNIVNLLISMTIVVVVIVILSGEDLSQHALNIVESVLMSLLNFHVLSEITIIPSAMLTDIKPVWTELLVPEEAYPMQPGSSSDY